MSSGVSDDKSPAPGACRTCAASQLISSFADAMDRSDLDAIGAHFAEDAVFVMPTGDQWRGTPSWPGLPRSCRVPARTCWSIT